MMCCISVRGKKLQLYQLCPGKTSRSFNEFKEYKGVTLELPGIRQPLAWFNKTHLVKYVGGVIVVVLEQYFSMIYNMYIGALLVTYQNLCVYKSAIGSNTPVIRQQRIRSDLSIYL